MECTFAAVWYGIFKRNSMDLQKKKILNYEEYLLLIRHLSGCHLLLIVISMVLDGAASCLVRLP
jgi:hypothetical protein